MKCNNCRTGYLVHDTGDQPCAQNSGVMLFGQVEGEYCSTCGEGASGGETAHVIGADLKVSGKQTVPTIVDPSFISSVRKKLDLDQREAAELFGGGVNAFSRYENGKTKPPLSLVKLLQVLDRHPCLLAEIRTG